MLQWIGTERGRRPRPSPPHDPREAASHRLAALMLLRRAELLSALERWLKLTKELLEAVRHNLHRRVLADRERLLELLGLLEEENRRLRQRLEEGKADGEA